MGRGGKGGANFMENAGGSGDEGRSEILVDGEILDDGLRYEVSNCVLDHFVTLFAAWDREFEDKIKAAYDSGV